MLYENAYFNKISVFISTYGNCSINFGIKVVYCKTLGIQFVGFLI